MNRNPENKEKVLISACLVGQKCRYDGQIISSSVITELGETYEYIAVCPETAGGLGVPRPKAWIETGAGKQVWSGRARVINERGADVTGNFKAGAEAALEVARTNNLKKAFLKSRSPSCGVGNIYNDSGEKLVKGNGVTAELLMENGVEVKSF